jgi:hypothetical protein
MGKNWHFTLFGIVLKQEMNVSNIMPFAKIYCCVLFLFNQYENFIRHWPCMMCAIKMSPPPHIVRGYLTQRLHVVENWKCGLCNLGGVARKVSSFCELLFIRIEVSAFRYILMLTYFWRLIIITYPIQFYNWIWYTIIISSQKYIGIRV